MNLGHRRPCISSLHSATIKRKLICGSPALAFPLASSPDRRADTLSRVSPWKQCSPTPWIHHAFSKAAGAPALRVHKRSAPRTHTGLPSSTPTPPRLHGGFFFAPVKFSLLIQNPAVEGKQFSRLEQQQSTFLTVEMIRSFLWSLCFSSDHSSLTASTSKSSNSCRDI